MVSYAFTAVMDVFAAFLWLACFILIGSNSAVYTGRRKENRNLRARAVSSELVSPPTGQHIRLVPDEEGGIAVGRVEVFIRGKFGAICDNSWDIRDADVVCKQIGFSRGAVSNSRGGALGNGLQYVMDYIACDEHAHSIVECDWETPTNCGPSQVAGVECWHNKGCPHDWIAGPAGCYQIPRNMVTRREFAVNKCASRGGHLVTIETAQENHFLSQVFLNESQGPILTGGIKEGGKWMWEEVSIETNGRDVETTIQTSIDEFKWFPGWQPGNELAEPTGNKKERCLFLSRKFPHPNGTDVDVGYHFWLDERCSGTRKRHRSGFRYMCERPLERLDVGCYKGIGTDYRGTASYTMKGTPCMKWTEANDINPDTYPHTGLGEHNYCRNPDSDEAPWCWISEGNFEFCDIPKCTTEEEGTSSTESGEEEETECPSGEFSCLDGRCIAELWKCDMEHDCGAGEDENQSCDYSLPLFRMIEGLTVRGFEIETYAGTTNETCARYCLQSRRFVCRSFSFSARTRECLISHHNTETEDLKPSRRENLFELRSQLDNCQGMFRCDNGRCVPHSSVCDGVDQCDDFSDETNCGEDETVKVRLVGESDRAGRVEVFYKGEWGLICDDNWDDKDAAVICSMLGYDGDAKALTRSYYGSGDGNILLDEVDCLGTETSIDQCGHDGWKKHDCYIWETAAVKCSESTGPKCEVMKEFTCVDNSSCISLNKVCDGTCQCPSCTDEETCDSKVELVHGNSPMEGRVEITLNGITGTICDDYFEDASATVICKMLGYSWGTAVREAAFGQGSGPIWMDDVRCIGNESDIITCQHFGPRDQNCGHDEDTGVICQTAESTITVELVNGSEYSGRVVLTKSGEKGTICDDSWDDDDATVICRMLGYSDGRALTGGFYGPGDSSLQIFLDDVQCTGSETSIELCAHSDWLVHNCEHSEDAGVTCRTDSASATVTTSFATEIHTVTQPTQIPETDCHNPDLPYTGGKAVTENGFECQAWVLDTPHKHKHHNDSAFPDGTVAAANNYCRSPDGDSIPWCYTTHPDERWGYCKIPKCKVNCFTVSSEYTGSTSHTSSGLSCQRWASNTPHNHKYHSDSSFPDDSVEEAGSYCRSPDDDVTPWCYTTNANVRWEYCNISRCAGGFDFNATCGLRPLENSRDRRDVSDEEENYDMNFLPYRKMGRIYGGSKASYGMYPWQAGIRRRLSGFLGYHLHHCGGTIIGEYWILSAAHCFRDVSKGQVVVRAGDLNSQYRDKYEQEFDVETIIPHERYNSQSYDYDIALIKVRPKHGRGIVFNDYVQPACLPNVNTHYVPGYQCLISGWGEYEDEYRSVHMKAARVPLVDHGTCNRLYKHTLTTNMACAGYLAGGVDSCAGDSGGPLVCKINDKYTVLGVVSFGEGCGVPNSPGVYARVSAFIPWINDKLARYG